MTPNRADRRHDAADQQSARDRPHADTRDRAGDRRRDDDRDRTADAGAERGRRFTPSESRRTFLRAVTATGLAASIAGCNEVSVESPTSTSTGTGTTQPIDLSFAANPAGLDSDAGSLGYELLDDRGVAEEYARQTTVSDGGDPPSVTASSHVASYRRASATVSPAGFAVLSTPDASVENTQYNPYVEGALADVIAGAVGRLHPWPHASADDDAMTDALPLLFGGSPGQAGWSRGPTSVATRQSTLLDSSTTLESFAGVTDADVFVLAHAARVVLDTEAILVLAVHSLDASDDPSKPLTGSDGFVSTGDVDATASATADAMAEVIRGRVPALDAANAGPIEIVNEEFAVTGSEPAARAALRVTARNVSGGPLEYAALTPEFYDASGALLAMEQDGQFFVDTGETFERVIALAGDPSAVASHAVETNAKPASTPESAENATVTSESLVTSDVEAAVDATVRNDGSALEYLGARVKFYDDGVLVDSGDAHVVDLSAGETWEFTVDYEAPGHDPYTDVTDYSLELVGQWWLQR